MKNQGEFQSTLTVIYQNTAEFGSLNPLIDSATGQWLERVIHQKPKSNLVPKLSQRNQRHNQSDMNKKTGPNLPGVYLNLHPEKKKQKL